MKSFAGIRGVLLVLGLVAGMTARAGQTSSVVTFGVSAPHNCVPPPVGLVAWWQGEGNADDLIGGNDGTLMNGLGFTNGLVGQSFNFNGANNYVIVNTTPSLNVGLGSGMTFEGWINPQTLATEELIFEFEGNLGTFNGGDTGVNCALHPDAPGALYSNLEGNDRTAHEIVSPLNAITPGVWQHIAITYDQASGVATLYVNGVSVTTTNFGSFTPETSLSHLVIGARTTFNSVANPGDGFLGMMDELSFYNRALSAGEIATIYDTGAAGKCAPQTVAPGACAPPPAGIVGWWKGDGTTVDVIGGNNGTLVNINYTGGVVGQAFACDPNNYPYGTYCGVQIPDSPAYVLTNALTIEGWIRPRGDGYNIFWRGDNRPGTDPFLLSMQNSPLLAFYIVDENDNSDNVSTMLVYGDWVHVAATYDGGAGSLSLYTNGVLAAQKNTTIRPFGNLIPEDSPGVGIGNVNDGGNNFPFTGDIDEIALYNRALMPAEIAAIYNAGSAGKCNGPFPPGIAVPPASETVTEGAEADFSVAASGTAPFSYQWTFGGKNLTGATNATLTLTNVHPNQAGNYAVKITSPYGSTNSANAVLTVISQNILVYKYTGTETIVTTGQQTSFPYSGMMFFLPDSTNGAFVGWATIKGKKTYWVNAITHSLWITIPGNPGLSYTLLGDAGSGFDNNGQAHLDCNMLKGWNTTLNIGGKKTFVFPNTFAGDNTHAGPDAQTGLMKLDQSISSFNFAAPNTQTANTTGQTLADLIAAQVKTLKGQGYQTQ